MAKQQTEAELDETDRALIARLRDNSRIPTATLARQLGVSRGTVQNRIDRLVASGILVGFTVRLRGDVETGMVRAITSLEVRSTDNRNVVAALKRNPEVSRIHSTSGRWDLVVEIQAHDLAALDQVLTHIRTIPAVTHSETCILLAELR
ncbi:Lrp/AsnC family transcriptional regulator [Limobrevibacterium gyesilva]|uniref:Lrp/AsnC family transcriptional regulator n=1 Tax=Limobrevibacterium gyesilva TaxID=2991712 RepID=A0AA41YR69_9PROT|nr:Lrp/AsnC family transcriptional regulator [Limobrevibacterium gyesilva]MCW3474012.1 Lrp/AsnC family transcriptional regulator [Limobrevibacterium gyesilva]